MPADFSGKRSTLENHAYVELKQGGVLLDRDFNEAMALLERGDRARTADVLGRAVVSRNTPRAFLIGPGTSGGLQIGVGRMYVDGMLAENRGVPSSAPVFDELLGEPAFSGDVDYLAQPFFPQPPALPTDDKRHLVYLDVWQREVTHVEQPDLVEVAVGVETSSRVQTVWQVRILEDDAGSATCSTPDGAVPGWIERTAPSSGVLSTGTFEVAAVDDPCELPPTGGYRGLENQLYRIEIHTGGQPDDGATFKWSREGGSVASAVASIVTPSDLELATLGRDDVLGFKSNDWVEILDDVREFSLQAGEMRRITIVEGTRLVQLDKPLPSDMLPALASLPNSAFPSERHLRVRLWNQSGRVFRADPSNTPVEIQNLDDATSPGVISVPAPGTAVLLEHGLTVSFDTIPNAGAGFKTGDYWLVAARTADASVELLDRAPSRGPHHHYARLAMWDSDSGRLTDCRVHWPPPVGGDEREVHDCGCTACVTADLHNQEQFTIQQAVEKVQASGGGTVCLGPGDYTLLRGPVSLTKARGLTIRGHGSATRITSNDGGAFLLEDCRAVVIERLAIQSSGIEPAIHARHSADLSLQDLDIEARSDLAPAVGLEGVVVGAGIRRNVLSAPIGILAHNPTPRDPQSFLVIGSLLIEGNTLACRERGISLAEGGIQTLSTRITDNQIVGCNDIGIRVLGIGARDSSLVISGNHLHISGDGIQCVADGVWLENNSVVRSKEAPKGRVGIELASGQGSIGTARCQILANQVSGFAHAGIEISGPARDLIIKLNIIEHCGNGIISTAKVSESSVSIENNHLCQIGSDGSPRLRTLGIFVAHAESAAIGGNSIHGLGLRSPQAQLRAAILALGVPRVTVSNNDIADVALLEEGGESAGIMLLEPYAQFSVSHNRVERDAPPVSQPVAGAWFALVTVTRERPDAGVVHTAGFATIAVDARMLVLGAGRPAVSIVGEASGRTESRRGSVLGNVLNARGGRGTPAVHVVAADECLFNDNRVELEGDGPFAVELVSSTPIVNANRVRGGETSSIDIQGTRSAAVLGNFTTKAIRLQGGGLQAPWKQLNIPE
jgi:hypothetical protein